MSGTEEMVMALVVDFGLAIVLLFSIVAGARNGFLDSLFSVASWIVGGVAALNLPRVLLPHLPLAVRAFPGAAIIAGVIVFLIVFALVRLLGMAISTIATPAAGPIDRTLGLIIGVLRGVLVCAVIGSFLVAYLPANGSILKKSRALPLLEPAAQVVTGLAPPRIRGRMEEGWARMAHEERRSPKAPVTV
jgi:membrane protein required for colicin V production